MSLDELIDARVREVVAEELARRGLAPSREERLLYTVPEAARLTSISVERLRLWIEEKRLPRRVKNPGAKKSVFLVSLAEIQAVAAGDKPTPPAPSPVDLSAARITRRGVIR